MQARLEKGGAVSPTLIGRKHTHEPTDGIQKRRVGLAAQHLVAADILLHGYDCSISAELLAYDLIADINGLRRVQVKCRATAEYRGARSTVPSYTFQQLRPTACDLFAFVVLPQRRVLYRHAGSITTNFIIFRPNDFEQDVDTFLKETAYWRSVKQTHHYSRRRNGHSTPMAAPR